jgi:hypothetical protein
MRVISYIVFVNMIPHFFLCLIIPNRQDMQYPSLDGQTTVYPGYSGLLRKGSSFKGENLYLIYGSTDDTKYRFFPWKLKPFVQSPESSG